MKILVNGYNLRNSAAGIATFTINALNALSFHNNLFFDVVVSPAISNDILGRIRKCENINIHIVGSKKSSVWFFLDLPKYIRKAKFDLLWNPSPLLPFGVSRKKKKLVTVHDFVSREFRDTMTLSGKLVTSFCERKTIDTADYLWCNSEYTKKKLQGYHPKRKCKVILVGGAPNEEIRKSELNDETLKTFLNQLGINKKYLLFVGSLEPRKNLQFLLNVFNEYHKTHDMQLVIVGARKWGSTHIADIVNKEDFPKEDVIFTPFIADADLCKLYTYAACYISTALNEGFGMPQAEAMKCECPVVTAHNSAMIEVVEGAGITVKDWNVNDWCNSIDYAILHKKEIVEKQNQRIKKYNWKLIADSITIFITN